MYALLFAEDPDEIAVLSLVLQRAGLAARTATTVDQMNALWGDQPLDLALLCAPEGYSIGQVRQLRAQAAIPIVVVCDGLEEAVHLALLEAGVDLAVTRPYSARLLIGQLRALMRRSAGTQFFSLPNLTQGELTLDPSTRTVRLGEADPKRLTQLEFRLLYTLMLNAGQVVSAEALVEHVWGYSGEGDRTLVRGLVKRLRSKVEPNPSAPRYIQTEPGLGYAFKPQS